MAVASLIEIPTLNNASEFRAIQDYATAARVAPANHFAFLLHGGRSTHRTYDLVFFRKRGRLGFSLKLKRGLLGLYGCRKWIVAHGCSTTQHLNPQLRNISLGSSSRPQLSARRNSRNIRAVFLK